MPVLVSLFNTRLKLAEATVEQPPGAIFPQAVSDLRSQIGRIPRESFPVKKVLHEVESAWNDDFWNLLTSAKAEFLRLKVAPLLGLPFHDPQSLRPLVDNFLGFLRHVLAQETLPDYGQVVRRAFERFIAAHYYNADQIRFLRSVQQVFLQNRKHVEADLYEPPLTQFGRNAVERYFTSEEIRELLDLAATLAA